MRTIFHRCIIYLCAFGFNVRAFSSTNYIDVSGSSPLSTGATIPSESWVPLLNDVTTRSAINTLDNVPGLASMFTPTPQSGLLQPTNWFTTPTTTSPISNVMDGIVRSVSTLDTTSTAITSNTPMTTDSYGLSSFSSPTFSTTGVRSGLVTPTNMAFTSLPVSNENLLPSGTTIAPRAGTLPTAVTPTWNTIGPATQSVSVTTPSITLRTVKTSVLPSIVQTNTAYHSNVHHKPKIMTPIIQKIYVPIKIPVYKPKPKMIKKFRMKPSFEKHRHKIITVPIGGPYDKYRQSYYGPYLGRASEFSFEYKPHKRREMLRPVRNERFERMRSLFDFDDGWDDF